MGCTTGIKGMNQLTLVGNEVSVSQLEEFAGNKYFWVIVRIWDWIICNQQKNR